MFRRRSKARIPLMKVSSINVLDKEGGTSRKCMFPLDKITNWQIFENPSQFVLNVWRLEVEYETFPEERDVS